MLKATAVGSRNVEAVLFGHSAFPLDSLGEKCLHLPKQFRKAYMTDQSAELLPGTLDLLILKALSLGPQHVYGVLIRIGQISGGALAIEQGALYPALYRLERQGLLDTEWGVSENNRRAKFYSLTEEGRKRLRVERDSWQRLAVAMAAALSARPGEA